MADDKPLLRPYAEIAFTGSVDQEVFDIHFLFDIIESNELIIDADITDNYVEDNTARQDHMALKPLTYTLTGLISEKVYYRKYEVITAYKESTSKLNAILALTPTVSNYANAAIGAYDYAKASYKRYANGIQNIVSAFSKNKVKPGATTEVLPMTTITQKRQTEIAQTLLKLRDTRTLVYLINTPFGDFDNPFLIQSAKPNQGDSMAQSQLSVTVKEYRSVATKTVKIDASKYAGRVGNQKATEENLGKVKGKEDLTSTLYRNTYGAWQQ